MELNHNINIFDLIHQDIIKLDNDNLDHGIWNIIDKYKENYPFLKQYYKEENLITQLIENFKNQDLFCFKYYSIEGYTICPSSFNKTLYLNSIILYDINY